MPSPQTISGTVSNAVSAVGRLNAHGATALKLPPAVMSQALLPTNALASRRAAAVDGQPGELPSEGERRDAGEIAPGGDVGHLQRARFADEDASRSHPGRDRAGWSRPKAKPGSAPKLPPAVMSITRPLVCVAMRMRSSASCTRLRGPARPVANAGAAVKSPPPVMSITLPREIGHQQSAVARRQQSGRRGESGGVDRLHAGGGDRIDPVEGEQRHVERRPVGAPRHLSDGAPGQRRQRHGAGEVAASGDVDELRGREAAAPEEIAWVEALAARRRAERRSSTAANSNRASGRARSHGPPKVACSCCGVPSPMRPPHPVCLTTVPA